VAHQIQDEGFHEIQLNGKQLVFLFMAATVVSVVIFLCGVLVGRGVRAERGALADADVSAITPATEVAEHSTPQQAEAATPAIPAGSDPTAAPPPAPVDDLSYFNRLEKATAPAEKLTPAPDKNPAPSVSPPPVAASRDTAPAAAAKPPDRAAVADTAPADPASQGFAVQIAALNVRSEADAIAKRLSSKGYAAYVLSPATGTPSVYRVRVGKFPTRREAESIAARLQKEEQFKPWVTR
jgi:DedD protein